MANGLLCQARPQIIATRVADAPSDAELLDQFVRRRDQSAFALLVRRHGPMVLGVSRRILRDRHLAEESFQLTFLVLVRKAPTLRDPKRLANWLYGVAVRVSRKAKIMGARRDARERAVAVTSVFEPVEDDRELHAVVDEEMTALPEKYRAPLVLCYLEGLTNEDAARQLGWAPGSMSYRLARGRELLRRRLVRRGLVCLALFPTFLQSLSERASAGELPEKLVDSTVGRAGASTPAPVSTPMLGRVQKLITWTSLILLLGVGTIALVGRLDGSAQTAPDEHDSGCHPTAQDVPYGTVPPARSVIRLTDDELQGGK